MRTTFVAAALAALIAATTVTAQTLTEQLQKGIYAEETLGDAYAAIAIYRRIVATAPAQHDVALQARRRLATSLERKGALQRPSAQLPHEIKGTLHAASADRTAQFVGGEPEPLGTVENARYRHTWTGVEFNLPEGWLASDTYRSSDSGQQVTVSAPDSRATMSVWMIKEKRAASDIAIELAAAPAVKVDQRVNRGYNIPGMLKGTYDIPKYSIQSMSIGGRQATMAIGEYLSNGDAVKIVLEISQTGRVLTTDLQGPIVVHSETAGAKQAQEPVPMNEYMTWIYTENTRAFFFARVKAADLVEFRPYFDRIIQSAFVP